MNLKFLFGALLGKLVFLATPAFPQTDTIPAPTLFITFSPQHLFVNGYYFYVEQSRSVNRQHSFIYSPRFYAGKPSAVDQLAGRQEENDQGRVLGFGAEVNHRLYLSKTVAANGSRFYLAYGPNFHHFRIKFNKVGWGEELGPDELKYYEKKSRPYHQKINRWGAMAVVGLQQPMYSERFVIDMYLGFGFTKSNIQSDYEVIRYHESAIDYGYSGLNLLAGIKFGVAFW